MIIGQTTAFISSAAVPSVAVVAPSFVNLCSSLAAPASVLVSAAPLPTIQQIKEKKDVGGLPLLPYSCMAANCVLWTAYGALRHTPSIWLPNGVGLLLALYYIQSFIQNQQQYTPAGKPSESSSTAHSGSPVTLHLVGVGAVVAAAALAFQSQFLLPVASVATIADSVGSAAVLFCIALFASPLSTLKTVVKTKSADSIPLPFSVASLLCCFFWSVTGSLELHDLNVIIPNALGFICGLAQVGLKLLYSGNSSSSKLDNTHQTSLHTNDNLLLRSTEAILTNENDFVHHELGNMQQDHQDDYVLVGSR